MRINLAYCCWLLLFLGLGGIANSCGGGASSTPPPPQTPQLSGVWEGTINNQGEILYARLTLRQNGSTLYAELSPLPEGTGISPVLGHGSIQGTSFALEMNPETGREFYLVGFYIKESSALNGTIHYPDSDLVLSYIFIYTRPLESTFPPQTTPP